MNTNSISTWGHGQLIAFSGIDGPTSYHEGLCLRTIQLDNPGPILKVVLPGSLILRLGSHPPLECDLASDHFRLATRDGVYRGALLDAWHLLLEGPDFEVEGEDPRLSIDREGDRLLLAMTKHQQPSRINDDLSAAIAERRKWVDTVSERLGVSGHPTATKALRQMKSQVYSPEGLFTKRWTTPDRWPHRQCWLWDSAFHAIGLRHCDTTLAKEAIDAVFSSQAEDGMIPIRCNPDGRHSSGFTQPPTLALAIREVDRLAHDASWVQGLLPKVEAYLQWDEDNRNSPNGLPCWAIESNPNCRSGESGLDNASRFDAATRMEAVDFASFLSLEWEILGQLYQQINDSDGAARCQQRRDAINAKIRERLWDPDSSFFRDWDLENDRFCPVMAVTGFLPLICGAATEEQVRHLLAHLENPETFGTPLALPSVARNDPTYEKDMWRGPVWVNMVYLIALGFERYGLTDTAVKLRRDMVREIEKQQQSLGTFFEYFDAEKEIPPNQLHRKGCLAPERSPYHQCFHDYGWTATLYLEMMLGLKKE